MNLIELVDKKYLKKIPEYKENLNGWESILIKDNKEELISLKNIDKKILVSPQYYINGIEGADNDCKVREKLAQKLITVANKLPDGFYLLIWDSYRTLKTQQSLFEKYYNIFKKDKKMDERELLEYTKKFVSLPSANKERPSPHNTGASVDLTICDETGKPIDFGTYFDDFRQEAYTRFFEEKNETVGLTEKEREILLNRRILCNMFSEEGFANYTYEIWHKSFGDQMSCKLLGSDYAIYGGIESH